MDRDENKPQAGSQGRDEKSGQKALSDCYGRIGIPAVAAALTPRHEEPRPARGPSIPPNDCD